MRAVYAAFAANISHSLSLITIKPATVHLMQIISKPIRGHKHLRVPDYD